MQAFGCKGWKGVLAHVLIALLYTGMGFPPVVSGLFVYLMLSRNGPLAGVALPFLPELFTPAAMAMRDEMLGVRSDAWGRSMRTR